MRSVEPEVFLISRPDLDYGEVARYLREVGGESWLERLDRGDLDEPLNDAQNLAEFAGRLCYRSWEPGLNPNVSRVRPDQQSYLRNVLSSLHGSVLEHVSFSFTLHNVSRVCCYDSDTEVLTSDGWIPWPKIDGTETFATVNPTTGALEYQRASDVYHGEYSGDMYRVRSEQVDLLVTPNHRMWVKRHDTQAAKRGEQPYGIETAEAILHKRVRYQKTAHWDVEGPDEIHIPATMRTYTRSDTGREVTRTHEGMTFPAEAFARFLGFYMAEGCVNRDYIQLAQRQGPVLRLMASTIEEMGLQPRPTNSYAGGLRVTCAPLRDFLAVLGTSLNKRVPDMVHAWSSDLIREFIYAMLEGDGTYHKTNGHKVIYTASPQLADDLQVLAVKAGWSANIRVDDRVGLERVMPNGQRFVNANPCHVVSIIEKRNMPLVNSGRREPGRYWNAEGYHDEIVRYEGWVHCVKVPNGLLLVRRNGKPVVSGNTHELTRHRPGVAISQESLRFVRLDDLPFWFPEWAREDPELMKRAQALLGQMEEFQQWMAGHFELDAEGKKFAEKKHRTSFMRRFAPEGVATGLVWTANVRTLRHTIENRTAPGAEEEIRLVFAKIGELMRAEAPDLFGDYTVADDGAWVPEWRKV